MDGARSRRRLTTLALAALLGFLSPQPLRAQPAAEAVPANPLRAPGSASPAAPAHQPPWNAPPDDQGGVLGFGPRLDPSQMAPGGCNGPGCAEPIGPWETGPSQRPWLLRQCDLRHSSTHGRAMGPGTPLRGTSWLNRPYWLSLDGGALLMADRPAANVRSNNDLLGAIGLGWDWDHYWGSQVRVAWSTPELLNTLQTGVESDDNLLITDLSILYYPWGDSRMRPYWRVGVGLTDVEYTNDLGRTQHDMLMTIPFGVGLKYQLRRHLTWRLEFMDNLALGQNETSTMNNFSITAGLEWRFGGRPDSHWGWSHRGGAW